MLVNLWTIDISILYLYFITEFTSSIQNFSINFKLIIKKKQINQQKLWVIFAIVFQPFSFIINMYSFNKENTTNKITGVIIP